MRHSTDNNPIPKERKGGQNVPNHQLPLSIHTQRVEEHNNVALEKAALPTASQHSRLEQSNKHKAKLPALLSPRMDERLRLLPRIAEYRLRNWITDEEERHFITMLEKMEYSANSPSDSAALHIHKRLEEIERKIRSKKKAVHFDTVSREHRSGSDSKKEEFTAKDETTSPIVHDERVHRMDSSTCSKLGLTSVHVADLFVEMCFFARLGFLQPPCCLKCSFLTSLSSQEKKRERLSTTQQCNRWVVWRQDASVVLSRKSLKGNLLLVRCNAAQELVMGQPVTSLKTTWRWDSSTQRMMEDLCS